MCFLTDFYYKVTIPISRLHSTRLFDAGNLKNQGNAAQYNRSSRTDYLLPLSKLPIAG